MRTAIALGLLFALISDAYAEPRDKMSKGYLVYINRIVSKINARPDLVKLIKDHNTKYAAHSLAQIVSLDKRWRKGDSAVINPILHNALSKFLSTEIEAARGRFSEIIVMGKRGLAIAVSPKTSDFWQGDEAKWLETYPKGLTGSHSSKFEFDQSTKTMGSQISHTMVINGKAVGAITIGVNIVFRGGE